MVGDTYCIPLLPSSDSTSWSVSRFVVLVICTTSSSPPRSFMLSVTLFVAPSTRETSNVTAITPMMIPSMVRKVRSLFDRMVEMAIFEA